MEITQQFQVGKSAEKVWALFEDIPTVAACMPGVELTEQVDASTFRGKMQVKLGPMRPAFEGEATIDRDEQARLGTIQAKGVDKRGGSRAEALVTYKVADHGQGALVDIVAELTLKGQLAQFGRAGILRDVSEHLTGEFARCLEAKLEAATSAEAAEVVAADVRPIMLFLRTLWARLIRVVRRVRGRDERASSGRR
jgi:uncharacterized protein